MLPTHVPTCDCCGFPTQHLPGDTCAHCGYPINIAEEERFLEKSLVDLQRVVTYGGARMTVVQLLRRYRTRLDALRIFKLTPVMLDKGAEQPAVTERPAEMLVAELPISAAPAPALRPVATTPPIETAPPATPGSTNISQTSLHRIFSLRSFFVDQTINIVASLGAFLILLGSLGFIATTTSLLPSFLTMFCVHAVFGIAGIATYRFRSFRVVSLIYTAIFALLVPLVGFLAYQLAENRLIQISSPMLVAIAATYAAIIYAALAIHQRFSPFAYLAVVALAVADLAVAYAMHSGYWWWPVMLMLLALPALLAEARSRNRFFSGYLAVLREPVRLLMFSCVAVCASGAVMAFVYSFYQFPALREVRFAIVGMVLLLLVWLCLFIWRSGRGQWASLMPYLFFVLMLVCCYAFELRQVGYILVLMAGALFYHGLTRWAVPLLQMFDGLEVHLDLLALVFVGLVPVIAAPLLSVQVLLYVYSPYFNGGLIHFMITDNAPIGVIAILCGCLVTIDTTLRHVGLQRVPDQARWCWLLLFSGVLLDSACGLTALILNATPVWWFLGQTLFLMACAMLARRLLSATWARPLDLLTLVGSVQTLLLSLAGSVGFLIFLLFLFAALFYSVILYQRRHRLLFLPLLFALLTFLPLLRDSQVLLLASLIVPLLAAVVHRLTARWSQVTVIWEWPLLVVGVIYAAIACWLDSQMHMSIVQYRLSLTLPVPLEIAALALIWYLSAALARVKWWLLLAFGFVVPALVWPGNSFWALAWAAPLLVVVAFALNRFVGRIWALPLYIAALLSALVMGVHGFDRGQLLAATWALFIFALVVYLVGVAMNERVWMWSSPMFAAWSVYYSGLLGDLYRPPIVALLCVAIGVGIGSLRWIFPPLADSAPLHRPLRFALPFYATACAAAVLTGLYGVWGSVNDPFYAAIPDTLLVYALVAYGVVCFERRPHWLILPTGFALWGVLLFWQTTAYYIVGAGLALALVGLVFNRIIKLPLPIVAGWKLDWGWPWYAAALLAALMLGSWKWHQNLSPMGAFIEDSLLAFAVLACVIGAVEDMLPALWVGAGLAIWSLVDSAVNAAAPRLFVAMLVCAMVGALSFQLKRFGSVLLQKHQRIVCALPFYAVAIAAAALTGVAVAFMRSVNDPFYAAMPVAFFIYALITYGILLLERRAAAWQWLVTGLALWGTLLIPRTIGCSYSALTYSQVCQGSRSVAVWLVSIAFVSAALGLVAGRFSSRGRSEVQVPLMAIRAQFIWNWSWYLTTLLAIIVMVTWNASVQATLSANLFFGSLIALTALTLAVMLIERSPEMLVVPVFLITWCIFQTQWMLWQQMMASIGLCAVVFGAQFVWRFLPSMARPLPATLLHNILSFGGLIVVLLLVTFAQGGLFVDGGAISHVGGGALFALAAILLVYGCVQTKRVRRHYCYYSSGLLFALVVPWELAVFHLTHLDWLTLAPASYLVIIAPFLSRDEGIPFRYRAGQLCSLLGSTLLLLPTLWLSFNQDNLQPTLVLGGESLLLLLLGITARIRLFVLGGAALVVVSAMHALFLPSLGIPPSAALAILGAVLLAIATSLSLARHWLHRAWTRWE